MKKTPRTLFLGVTLLSVLFSCKPQEAETIPVASISVNPTSLTLDEGETSNISATVSPGNATDKTVTWSSSSSAVATVKEGVVTAVKEGTATITAKAGNKTATCAVKVQAKFIAVTSVTLDKTSLEMTEGEEISLTATVKPDDATDKTVTWTSENTDVATVKDGKVTAVKEGTSIITAKTGDKTATCKVTVKKAFIAVTSISLDKTSLTMTVNEEMTLTATVKPDNATDQTVTWTSSNTSIATVDNGKVKGIKVGMATITAKAGDKTATCKVTVKKGDVAVTSISLDKTSITLTEGEEENLTATVKPDNATDKTVTWSSSDTAVATVKDGKVKGIKAGTATITAKAGDKTATCKVTVSKAVVAVTSVTLNKTSLTLKVNGEETLTATVKPDNATDKTVTWTSSNTAVATVKNGTVKGIKEGTAVITAKAGDKSAKCNVTVKADPVPVIRLEQSNATIAGAMSMTYGTVSYTIENVTDTPIPDITTSDERWLQIESFNSSSVTFRATKNSGSSTRTGTLTFSYKNAAPQVFTVKQYPASYCQLVINETTREVSREAGTYRVDYTLTHPLDGYGFSFITSPQVNWLTAKCVDGVISFSVTKNTSSESRSCRLRVLYEAAESPVWITVTQLGDTPDPIIELSPNLGDIRLEPEGEQCHLIYCHIINPIPGVELVMKSDVDWITDIEPFDEDQYLYCFKALRNGTGKTRYGHVDITYGPAHKQLTYVQEADIFDVINLDPDEKKVNYQGQSISFTVTLAEGYDYKDLKVSEESISGYVKNLKLNGKKVTFDVTENNSQREREAYILVQHGSASTTFRLVQTYEAPSLSVSPTSLNLNFAKQESLINVQITNPREKVSLSVLEVNDTDWLSCYVKDGVVHVAVTENTTGSSRKSAVEISYSNLAGKIQVPVTQDKAHTALSISPTSISCGANGTTQTFSITVQDPQNGVDVNATAADSWIKINSVSNTSASVTVEKNLTGSSRQSSIKFTYANLVATVKVTQEGNTVPDGFVDLGLPSGTLWATCNLGAGKEEEAGNYYAWGEIATKSRYTWDNYKWGKKGSLTKYNATDKKATLDTADDPAYQKNSSWSTPTRTQFEELLDECIWEWVTAPVPGYRVKAKTGGSSIFLPAVGFKGYDWQDDLIGCYWSKNLYTSDRNQAYFLNFTESSFVTYRMERCDGLPIRPVTKK